MPEDPTTNQLLADILNRLDALEGQMKIVSKLVTEMPNVADTMILLLGAVKELQETVPHDIRERIEDLENPPDE